jgi:RNA polymerase sigma-70 factor (ECF subfamily)
VVEPSDLQLVTAAASGDEAAFHALIDRHAKTLFRVAMSMSHNRADAEDLMQETFVGAYRGLPKFDGRSSVKTWLTSIMTRQAAKGWHRGRHHRAALSIHAAADGDQPDRPDASLTTGSATATVDAKIDVMQVLKQIDAPFREVLVMREMQGMSYEEMATALGVPRGTVESRLHRARAELRERLMRTEKS